jgi:hypothetical protein
VEETKEAESVEGMTHGVPCLFQRCRKKSEKGLE